MAFWSSSLGLLLLLFPIVVVAANLHIGDLVLLKPSDHVHKPRAFREAPAFRNGKACGGDDKIHVAMTLDGNYLRGTMGVVFSSLRHSACPENLWFHFVAAHLDRRVMSAIKSTFPYLNFHIYLFDSNRVRSKISKSVRQALDQPLNYARIYLSDILPANVRRVIYLDSDLVLVDDIANLWRVDMDDKVLAAPEYCKANFTTYFTKAFWEDMELAGTFKGRRACYFNTGVMVVDVYKWRTGGYTHKVEEWMAVQKRKRIYHLGSLPPFLLVLAGNIRAVDHKWNLHGLGGDNFRGNCRRLHPGPISLLHWSGKGKPWLRLDSMRPCPIDHLWKPYDLYTSLLSYHD